MGFYRPVTSKTTVYRFKRSVPWNMTLNQSTGWDGTSNFSNCLSFALSHVYYRSGAGSISVPAYTEFTSLFDQWRIEKVNLRIIYGGNVNTNNTSYTLPLFYMAPDYNNETALTGEPEIMQKSDMRIVQMGTNGDRSNIVSFPIVPKVSTGVYEAAVWLGYGETEAKQWLDTGYPDVKHYGVKIWFSTQGLGNNTVMGPITFVADVYYAFRGVE